MLIPQSVAAPNGKPQHDLAVAQQEIFAHPSIYLSSTVNINIACGWYIPRNLIASDLINF